MSLPDMAATLKRGLGVDWAVRWAARFNDNARQASWRAVALVARWGRPIMGTVSGEIPTLASRGR
jgi:hypothetical protein